jgi:hypothetical protein
VGTVAGQAVTLCLAVAGQALLPASEGFGCLLVGGLLAGWHGPGEPAGGPACGGVQQVTPQGTDQFLWIGHLSSAAFMVIPLRWDGSSFDAAPEYAVCYNNPTVPVTSPEQCFRQP